MPKKTVLITGCSTGIGRLAALTFQRKGWNVVATMRSPEREAELSGLDSVTVKRLDVTVPESVASAVDSTVEQFGTVDVLVNNAGRGGRALLEQTSDERTLALFETNVFGLMRVTRAVLPHMRRAGRGRIINVTSMAGLLGLPAESIYTASKYAVEGFTESLYWECKPLGILVKSVAPGVYRRTSFPSNVDDEGLSEGGEDLVAHAKRLREHFASAATREGGGTADPQEVADRIFECSTTDSSVRNLVGSDAERIMGLMGNPDRQAFLDEVEPLLIPPS